MPTTTFGSTVSQAASIGLIYDRTAYGDEPLCSAFLIGDKAAVTIASILSPYKDTPKALKVTFPLTRQEWGVRSIHIHPKFDQVLSERTVQRGTMTFSPDAALQRYNCAILKVDSDLDFVTEADIEAVSKALRYPIDLSQENFTGSLQDIDLTIVLQTLNNARKEGILYICDPLTRPIAQIFVQGGRIVSAKFGNLMNELAVFQIIQKKLNGKFVFYPCPSPAWLPAKTITMPADALLLESYRRLDELNKLTRPLKNRSTNFARANKACQVDSLSRELREHAELLWRVLDANTPAEQLWLLAGTDDYTVFKSLLELHRTSQAVRLSDIGTTVLPAMKQPVESDSSSIDRAELLMAPDVPLNPFDTIINLSFDGKSDRVRARTGSLLGAIDPHDSHHLLHDLPLLPYASGTPIFKHDVIIGMHCGMIPTSAYVKNSEVLLQQMLWVESIYECLRAHQALIPVVPHTADPIQPDKNNKAETPGCNEIASITCPGCGEKTFESARVCHGCGFEFVPEPKADDAVPKPHKKKQSNKMIPAIVAAVSLIGIVGGAGFALSTLPPANIQTPDFLHFSQPAKGWVDVKIEWLVPATGLWATYQEPKNEWWNTYFNDNDKIRFLIKGESERTSYVYMLYSPAGSTSASLLYPPEGYPSSCAKGSEHLYPSRDIPAGSKGMFMESLSVSGAHGEDRLLVFAFPAPPTIDLTQADYIFKNALEALKRAHHPRQGLIVDQAELLPHDPSNPPNLANRQEIFITSLSINH